MRGFSPHNPTKVSVARTRQAAIAAINAPLAFARRLAAVLLAASALHGFGAARAADVQRVGVLSFAPLPQAYAEAFRKSLREQGFADGKDVLIVWRAGNGTLEAANQIAAELVQMKVNVIVASLTPAVTAAMKATKTIPIVMAPVADPVATGFVQSLAHPGGNVTGITNIVVDVGSKLLGLLREVQPGVTRVAFFLDSRTLSAKPLLEEAQAAAAKAGMRIVPVWVSGSGQAPAAFQALARQSAQAVIVQPLHATKEVAELARQHHLPSIATGIASRSFPRAGGLLGYGSDPIEHYQRAGVYVAKILRGAKPADLPVEQATTLELIINMKTAKALGLAVPKDMLVRASEVIDQ
jgi:putative ABC transport system substrate-binding protein